MAEKYKASIDTDYEKDAIDYIEKLKVGQHAKMNKIKISLLNELSLTQIDSLEKLAEDDISKLSDEGKTQY